MKNLKNKKGFTIVELVIVIAVIAILAAVLIPTFSNVIAKANASAVQQEAVSQWKEAYALDLSDGVLDGYEGDPTVADNKISSKYTAYATYEEDGGYSLSKKGYTATLASATGTWTVTADE